jgi:hypothetical protein
MTKRETGFLLIGLGVGLVFAVCVLIRFLLFFQHFYGSDIHLNPASVVLAIPFLLIVAGVILIYRRKKLDKSN